MSEPKIGGVCVGSIDDLVPMAGVCARVGTEQIALFYAPGQTPEVFAIGNWDPLGKAAVLSRGLICDIGGRLTVASPLYKQHYDLRTGECLEDDSVRVPSYAVRVEEGKLMLESSGEKEAAA